MSLRSVKLGDVVDVLSGFAFKSEFFNDSNGLPVIRIRDVVRGFTDTYYSGPYTEPFVVQNGDILIGMDGNFNAARWRGGKALLNQRVCKVTAKADLLDEAFLFHYLPIVLKKIEDATPFVTVKHLSAGDLRGEEIPLPPLPEQRRIAAILDKADALRTQRREALAQLDRLAQAIFVEMFGDPGTNPNNWPLLAIGSLIREKPNNGIFRKNEEYGNGVPVAWVEELFRGQSIDVSESRRLDATLEEVSKYGLKHGDVLFCRSSLKLAGLGYNNVYLGPDNAALFECHVIRISPVRDKIDSEFLNFLLRIPSQRQRLFRFAKTVTMSTIDQEGIKSIEVPVPPLDLQKAFVGQLHAIQESGKRMRLSTVPIDELFSCLQHRAFRGEL